MPLVGVETTTLMYEWEKTVHTSDCSAPVISCGRYTMLE
jgi:hypothetical protein